MHLLSRLEHTVFYSHPIMYSNQSPEETQYRRFPKSPINRRIYAFAIDFGSVWILGSFFWGNWFLQFLVLFIFWFALRVILVDKNRGQSLGRWLLDIKVINRHFKRNPGLQELSLREAINGGGSVLAMIGINYGFPNFLSVILLSLPLFIDCGLALVDEEFNLAFHDRVSSTIIVPTKRGFSLDLRIKKLWKSWKRRKIR